MADPDSFATMPMQGGSAAAEGPAPDFVPQIIAASASALAACEWFEHLRAR